MTAIPFKNLPHAKGDTMGRLGIKTNYYRIFLTAAILVGPVAPSQAAWTTIHNDFFQIDQTGASVNTRSGCLRKFNNTYYWYGSAGGFTNQTCYSSTDLMHWTYKGVVIKAAGTNRMDVIYNDSTKQYVMFLKTQNGTNCDMGIATSSTPDGQFTLKGNYKVFGYQIGDPSVYQDDDGKAYFLFVWDSVPGANSGDKSEQAIGSLSSDYLSLSQKLFVWHVGSREAPMMMKHNGIFYYMTSLTLWTTSTATQYYTATSIAGPYTTKLTPVITPGSTNSWDTQCDFIFPLKGTQGTVYMYCGDRWEKPNELRQGDYAWLPIAFSSKDSVIINYYQDWDVDLSAGTWRPFDYRRNLALHKTATASSTSGSNAAGNVTDSATYSNFTGTRWTSAAADPQWIRIDLGSPMSVNRVILKWDTCYAKAFTIQVSTDASAWTDVFSTTAGGKRSVTDETFPTTTARYVRMNGTQRGNTAYGYSLFDFLVLNDSMTTATDPRLGKLPAAPVALLTCKNNTVHFSVPSNNSVRLDVVDSRGKLVAVLVDGFRRAGDYKATLPAALGSGMYGVRLTVGTKRAGVIQIGL
jgi:hypothetical protein